jgi:hypothetical protein
LSVTLARTFQRDIRELGPIRHERHGESLAGDVYLAGGPAMDNGATRLPLLHDPNQQPDQPDRQQDGPDDQDQE